MALQPFPRTPASPARRPAAGPGRNSANFMSEPSQPIRTDSFTYARSHTRSSSPEVVEVPDSEEEVVEGEGDVEGGYRESYEDYVVPIPPETPPRTRRHGTPLPRAQSASSYVSRPSWGTNRSRPRAISPDVFDAVTERMTQQRRATPGVRGRPRARTSAAGQEEEDFEGMPRGRPLTRLASRVSPTKRAASVHGVPAISNSTTRRSQSAAAPRIAVPATRNQPQRGRPPAALSIAEAISQSLAATPHAATTYQPSFALPPGPPKRPRGRPRIHPLAPESQVVKRGPGRPRKHPLPLESAVVKKPVGRPRKHPLPMEGEVVKRSPGRPRKNPLPPTANDHHQRQATQDVEVVKRGPGRPRKSTLPGVGPELRGERPVAQVGEPVKRPRGRPRKISLPAVGSLRDGGERPAAQAEEPVKKPRGRPRKSAPAALPAAPVRMSLVPVNVYGRSASKPPARVASVASRRALSPSSVRPEQPSTAGPSAPSHPPRNRAYVLIDSSSAVRGPLPAARAERVCAEPECENRVPPRGKYRFASCRSCRARKVVARNVDVQQQALPAVATPMRAVEQPRVVERHGWTLLTENPEEEEEEEEEQLAAWRPSYLVLRPATPTHRVCSYIKPSQRTHRLRASIRMRAQRCEWLSSWVRVRVSDALHLQRCFHVVVSHVSVWPGGRGVDRVE
ncbi:uncharacterized protein LAESUDRAFT_732601 [Laetiporus sulphureus 93-53]|uniref:Uncharacterized protein n=1 Tax=Laetiporus sulphureus 93-53 TaxID=1314785 RepID=A0A165B2D2_9APHY|nr:uncharacterized protein LAESUDRAFT_732601 [Laetiporus sulphureus 93-53]KZT00096.1 hypothetical protein LAESUDRAFT_732601 [Laetiporus sulphureus 93-53]